MKKALLIFSILLISFIGINELNADVYVSNKGQIHYNANDNFTGWLGQKTCGNESTCYFPFPDTSVYSFYYISNINPSILKVGKVYDLYFTFSINNLPSDALSLGQTVTNFVVSVIHTDYANLPETRGATTLTWVVDSFTKDTVTIKATFKVDVEPRVFEVGVGFSSGRAGNSWGYQVNQIFQIEENTTYLVDDKLDETNDKLDDLNNSITDETPPDTSEFEDVSGWLPPGPVDSILTLPLNVLNSMSNALNGKCTSIEAPLPFIEKKLEIMCGTEFYSNINGLSLFLNTLFTILGGVMLYKYFVYLYNWIKNIVSLKERDEKWGAV